MSIGDGAGTSISFSQIQAFYGGVSPISISEYARGGDNVPSSFSGSSTATTGTTSQTVDDFAVTVTQVNGDLQTSSNPMAVNAQTATFTVTSTTSYVMSSVSGSGTAVWYKNGTAVGVRNPTNGTSFSIGGPQFVSGDRTLSTQEDGTTTLFSAGDVFSVSTSSNVSTNTSTHGTRATEFDINFTNNSSTGDTYTLTSSSTGHSSKSVYAAGDSFDAQDNGSGNQFVIAYDNVSGTGSGTAGDITVTVAAGSNKSGSVSATGHDPSVTAPSTSGISFVNATAVTGHYNNDDNQTVHIKRNGTIVASRTEGQASSANVTYTGTISPGDVMSATGTGASGEIITVNYTTPTKSIVFTNNTSTDFALGSSTTPGGARVVPANGSTTAQQGGSTNNQAWTIYFDSSSGDCNTNLPTTISSGNPVNLDLFNAPGTPVA